MSGLVGNASMNTPPAPKPFGTAKPEAVIANRPAPPALSFSMSLRVRRTLCCMLMPGPLVNDDRHRGQRPAGACAAGGDFLWGLWNPPPAPRGRARGAGGPRLLGG